MLKRFLRDESGLETVEYAIITGLIVAGTITFIGLIGIYVSDQFELLEGTLNPATAP